MIHDPIENAAKTRAAQVEGAHFTERPCCINSHRGTSVIPTTSRGLDINSVPVFQWWGE